MSVKLAVVYYSTYGTNHRMAEIAAEAARAAGAEVRLAHDGMRVTRVVVVQDCGLVINPDRVRAQVEGNVMMAIGQLLFEHARFDAGGAIARQWSDYPLAGMDDLPELELELLEPAGADPAGAGEVALIAVLPALLNAVRDAGGPRAARLPLRDPGGDVARQGGG